MLDIGLIRQNPQKIKEICINKGIKLDIDEFMQLDEKKRSLQASIDSLKQQRNEASKAQDYEKGKQLKESIQSQEEEFDMVSKRRNEIMLEFPNIPSDDTPVGKDDSENVILKKRGTPKQFDFDVKAHFEIGEDKGFLNFEKAGQVAGSRFAYIMSDLVFLHLALVQYAFRTLTDKDILASIIQKNNLKVAPTPFIPVLPPVFIKFDVMKKMARLDPMEDRFTFPTDGQALIGSAEHTLGPLHMDEVLDADTLPRRYVGYSTSFRREAGSYGKDTRGLIRMHQFEKVEMESFCLAKDGLEEQNFLVAIQEYFNESLGLPYQTLICCTGDMGGPDARHIDIETWLPSQNKYRETHSADLMTDFQSRRLNTKVKLADGTREFIHMNDATAFAGRTLVAIMENYQLKDGRIEVPAVLRPYIHKDIIG